MGRESRPRAVVRLRENEGGWTLVELLAVMAISLIVGAAALMMIQTGESSSTKTSARQEAVQQGEVALTRIAKELRLATTAVLRSSRFLDLKTFVRVSGGSSQLRRIQYDCSDLGAGCRRKDCGAAGAGTLIGQPPGCTGTVTELVRGLAGAAFGAEDEGAAVALPAEATGTSPAFDYVTTELEVRLDDLSSGRRAVRDLDPVEIQGGVRLENVGTP